MPNGEAPPPPDPLTQALPTTPPATWAGREDRVRWVRANLTEGELALLYKLEHDVARRRRDACDEIVRKEKKACG
jgi:hypothetical protein